MPDYLHHLKLRQEIIKILAFFDMFDYPLTLYEVWQELGGRVSLGGLLEVLGEEDKSSQAGNDLAIAQQRGFYFLSGRERIVAIRSGRYNYTQRKLKIARLFGRFFAWCPWVRAVALANSIGAYNLRDGGDIDFFIITAPRRIWLSRLYCAGLAQLLKRRPGFYGKRDKLCLSFYLSLDHLNIDHLRLSCTDPYFDRWRQQLVLLYNKHGAYQKFLQANNLPDGDNGMVGQPVVAHHCREAFPAYYRNFRLIANIWNSIKSVAHYFPSGDWCEAVARAWQLKIMPTELRSAAGNTDGVVISNQVLKFYLRDRRRSFAKRYEYKIRTLV